MTQFNVQEICSEGVLVVECNRGELAAGQALSELQAFCFRKLAQDLRPMMTHFDGNLLFGSCGRGARSFGISEDMQIRESLLLDKCSSLLEFGIRFAREASHDVGADCSIGHERAHQLDSRRVVANTV